MNQQQIEQYVSGRMSEAEASAFEEYCVANPEFAKQVEFEQRLKAGLKLVASGPTEEFVRSEPERWKFAVAASVLFAVLAGGAYFWQRLPGVQPAVLATVPAESRQFTTLRLALVRGAENLPHLSRGRVRVEIVGLFDTGFTYHIALDRIESDQNIVTVAALHGQQPSTPVTLEVMVDSAQLEPGSYFLRVRKEQSDEEALDFSFIKN